MTMVNKPSPPEHRLRKPQPRRLATHQALVAAARAIVVTQGVAGLRTEEVVRQAGVAKGTFFAHFPDREHLVATLAAQDLTRILAAQTFPINDLASLRQALEPQLMLMSADLQVIAAMIRFSAASDTDTTGMAAALCRHEGWIAAHLEALQARAAIRRDLSPALLAQGVQALILQRAIAAACAPDLPEDRLADLLAALLARPD